MSVINLALDFEHAKKPVASAVSEFKISLVMTHVEEFISLRYHRGGGPHKLVN